MGDQYNLQEPAPSRNRTRRRSELNDYDTLLPVQYYDRVAGGNTPSGEFRLFFAILEDALRCYVRSKNCRTGAKRADFLDARRWFFTRGTPHVFSFESICSFLGLDASWLRRRLESLAPSDLPMKQFHTRRRRLARLPSVRRKYRPARSAFGAATVHTLSPNGHALSRYDATNGHDTYAHEAIGTDSTSNGDVGSGTGQEVLEE